MNDLAEVRQGWDFIRNWLTTQPNNWATKVMSQAAGADHWASSAKQVFMCCASVNGDDANQWRLYANNGRGYAVELDPSVPLGVRLPDDVTKPTEFRRTLEPSVRVTPWLHVLYSDAEKNAALGGLLRNALADWEAQEAGGFDSEEERRYMGELAQEMLIDALASVAQLMKSSGFEGEAEVRTIVTAYLDGHFNFRATENGVLRYVRLVADLGGEYRNGTVYREDLGDGQTIPVTGVRLGPCLSAQNNVDTVGMLLRQHGFKVAARGVSVSDVPLRP